MRKAEPTLGEDYIKDLRCIYGKAKEDDYPYETRPYIKIHDIKPGKKTLQALVSYRDFEIGYRNLDVMTDPLEIAAIQWYKDMASTEIRGNANSKNRCYST
jgi:hypothetical protein